jgi:Bacterial Ig domain/Bacterial TSP3 repeat
LTVATYPQFYLLRSQDGGKTWGKPIWYSLGFQIESVVVNDIAFTSDGKLIMIGGTYTVDGWRFRTYVADEMPSTTNVLGAQSDPINMRLQEESPAYVGLLTAGYFPSGIAVKDDSTMWISMDVGGLASVINGTYIVEYKRVGTSPNVSYTANIIWPVQDAKSNQPNPTNNIIANLASPLPPLLEGGIFDLSSCRGFVVSPRIVDPVCSSVWYDRVDWATDVGVTNLDIAIGKLNTTDANIIDYQSEVRDAYGYDTSGTPNNLADDIWSGYWYGWGLGVGNATNSFNTTEAPKKAIDSLYATPLVINPIKQWAEGDAISKETVIEGDVTPLIFRASAVNPIDNYLYSGYSDAGNMAIRRREPGNVWNPGQYDIPTYVGMLSPGWVFGDFLMMDFVFDDLGHPLVMGYSFPIGGGVNVRLYEVTSPIVDTATQTHTKPFGSVKEIASTNLPLKRTDGLTDFFFEGLAVDPNTKDLLIGAYPQNYNVTRPWVESTVYKVSVDGNKLVFPVDKQGGDIGKVSGWISDMGSCAALKLPHDTLDTIPPAAPVCTVTGLTPTKTVTCTGVEPGATLTIPGTTCVPTPATATATVVCTETTPGSLVLPAVATVKDPSGNVNTAPVISGDITAPSAPTINAIDSNDTVITGKGEPGATITLKDGNGNPIVCTNAPVVVAPDGTYACTLAAPLPTGTKVTATQKDPAGNVSGPANTTVTDSTNPLASAAPTVNPINNKDTVVTGKGVPGSAITVTGANCTNAPIVVAADGTWVCKLAAPLPVGTTVGATQTEPGKTVSPVTDTKVADAATTTPAAPVINPSNGKLVTGYGEPGATIKLTDQTGNPIACSNAPIVVAADGTWTCTPVTPIPNGTVISATQTDPEGNVSGPAKTTVDTIPPTAPICTVTGTTPTKTVTCTGVEPGTTLTIPGTICKPTPAPSSGIVVCTETTPGSLVLPAVATVTDLAGNTVTTPVKLGDTTAPSAPTINSIKSTDPVVTGKGEPGATIKLTDASGNPIVCTNAPVVVAPDGTYSCTLVSPLPTGTKVSANQTDPAGNVSAPANTTVTDPNNPLVSAAPTVNPVNNKDAVVTGKGIPGSAITVQGATCTNAPIIVAGDGSWVCKLPAPLPVGTTVGATQTEPGKSVSPVTDTKVSDALITAPAAPVINPTNGKQVTGLGEPGATIKLTDGNGNPIVCTNAPVIVAADGTWTCTPVTPLPGGTVVKATQTDPEGNVSGPTQTIVDATPPPAPVCTVTEGTLKTVTCTGVEPGATLTIPGTTCKPTPAPTSGIVVCTETTPGALVLPAVATVTDPAGNTNTAPVTLAPDTTAPLAPTINPTPTTNTNPLIPITGTCEPGAIVTLVVAGQTLTGPCTPTGTYAITPNSPLPIGTNPVTATQKDPAGNVSPLASSTVPVVNAADTTPPLAPTINSGPATNTNPTPSITGTCEPGATVTVSIAGQTLTGPCSATGTYAVTPTSPLPVGTNPATVTQKDAAGNVSPLASGTIPVVSGDTSAPSAPTINPIKSTDTVITGKGEPGATIKLTDASGNPIVCTNAPVIVAADGTYTCTLAAPLPLGTKVTATQTDPAGNVSGPANTTVTDPNNPLVSAAPTVNPVNTKDAVVTGKGIPGSAITVQGATCTNAPIVVAGDGSWVCKLPAPLPVGTVVGATQTEPGKTVSPVTDTKVSDAATSTPSAPVINPSNGKVVTGYGEPGATVKLTDPTGAPIVCTPSPTVVAADGTWTCTPATPIPNGTVITATQTDPQGNVSGPVKTTIDSVPPAAPVCTVTNGTPNTVTCTNVEPGATLTIPGTTCKPTPAPTSGTVVCTENAPGSMPANPLASVTDPAGNVGSAVVPYTPTVADTTAPTAPTINPTPTTNTNPLIPITGTCEPGAIVTLVVAGQTLTGPCTPTGTYAITPNSPLPIGTNPVTATQKDPAGNVSPLASSTVPVVNAADTTPPAKPTCTAAGSPAVITCTGVEPGATLTIPGATCTPTPAGANGIVVCTELAPGSVTFPVQAIVRDPSGNTTVSDPIAKPADTTAPTAPTINPTPTTNTNPYPTITGNCEPGATVTVLVAGQTLTAPCTPTGTYAVTPTSPLPVGTNPVTVSQKDPAGNTSPLANGSAPVATPADTTPPAKPTCTAAGSPAVITCTGVEPGATLTIPGATCVPTPAGANGIVTCTELAPGAVSFPVQAIVRDPSGNTTVSDPIAKPVVTDTTPPAKPTCTAAGSPAVITCTGVEPGATLTIPGSTCVPTPAGANGIVTCTELAPGSVSFPAVAVVKDPFGNTTVSDPIVKPVVTVNPCVPNPNAVACPTGDADGDGTPNSSDIAPTDPCMPNPNASTCPTADTDGDGVPNTSDLDPKNPCVPSMYSPACDMDGDGIPNGKDLDGDGDGSPDSTEVGDVNGDGILDKYQPNVVTVETTGGTKSTLVFEGVGDCAKPMTTYASTEGAQVSQDPSYKYPWGLVGFKIKCATTTKVTAIWPTLTKAQLAIYRKAGNTIPGQNSSFGYYDLPKVDTTVNGYNAVQYILTDGLKGDDTVADGYIYDPSGPGELDPTTGAIDSDKDGVPDAQDPNPTDACIPYVSAANCDLDKDGIPNMNDLDDDGDGISDLEELQSGTDPYNKNTKPTGPVSNCTVQAPCYTGCNSTCSNMTPAPSTCNTCGQSTCGQSPCGGCCGGNGINNITNTNTVTITGGAGPMMAPVYNYNNVFNSNVNFTQGPISFDFSPVVNNYYPAK